MFWFLVLLLVLVVWLVRKGRNPDQTGDAPLVMTGGVDYDRGRSDAYASLREQIVDALRDESTAVKTLRQMFNVSNAELFGPKTAVAEPKVGLTVAQKTAVSAKLQHHSKASTAAPAKSQAEVRAAQTVRNLNLMLYTGSFLIVAAMGVFVTLTMPAFVKLLGLIGAVLAFYVSGLLLHERSVKMRAAATAFVGTGLAILPFMGFALNTLGGFSPSVAWLVTSLVGVVAYGFAALRLQSQLVSYATIAFVIAMALSMVATTGLGVVWYYLAIVGISAIFNLVRYLAPNAVPKVFIKPVEQAGLTATPVVLLLSVLSIAEMDAFLYEILFGVSALHYLAVWLVTRQYGHEYAVRVLAHITAAIVAFDVFDPAYSDEYLWICVIMSMLWVLQIVYSLARVRVNDQASRTYESVTIFAAATAGILTQYSWYSLSGGAWGAAAMIAMYGLLLVVTSWRLQQTAWLYGTLITSVMLPYVVLRLAVDPALEYAWVGAVLMALGVLATVGLWLVERVKKSHTSLAMVFEVAAVLHLTLGLFTGLVESSESVIAAFGLAAAAGYLLLSYVTGRMWYEVLAALAFMAGVSWTVDVLVPNTDWTWYVSSVMLASLYIIGSAIHHLLGQIDRRNILATFAAIAFVMLLGAQNANNEQVQMFAVVTLVIASTGTLAMRIVLDKYKESFIKKIGQAAYVPYLVLAFLVAVHLDTGWWAFTLTLLAGVLYAASYIENKWWLMFAANLVTLGAVASIWQWLAGSNTTWELAAIMWGSAVVYGVMYVASRIMGDDNRVKVSISSLVLVLGIVSVAYIFGGVAKWVGVGAGSLFAISIILAEYGYSKKQYGLVEVSVYLATFAAQRAVSVVVTDLSVVVYAHWWTAVIVAAAWVFIKTNSMVRYVIAMVIFSLPTASMALTHGDPYTYLFLVEHAVVMALGATKGRQWLLWWGVVSVVGAVLYFVRDYPVVILLMLGMMIIGFVVWRLNHVGKTPKQ